MAFNIDHIVIFVRDLETATQDFTLLGFTVLRGGGHDNTENALIILQDETYIELLALKSGIRRLFIRTLGRIGILDGLAAQKSDMYWRLLQWISGRPGVVDWCVRTKHIKTDIELWENYGAEVIAPQKFTRNRPDGKVAKWYLAGAKTFDLPFLLEDITDKEIRVPSPHMTSHSNGTSGLNKIILSLHDPEKAMTQLSELNIAKPHTKSLNDGTMTIGAHTLQITRPDKSRKRIRLHLVYSGSEPQQLNAKLCHNADIWLVPQA